MATFSFRIYGVDPWNVFSQTAGNTSTWSSTSAATGTLDLTDNGGGAEETYLTDASNGETATGDITFPGTTISNADIHAGETWILEDSVTGEQIKVTTITVNGGASYYTISSVPLVEGRSYETIQFDATPDQPSGTQFDYDEYNDGTVLGTAGNDTIDRDYTGDPNGDKVDANDLYTSQTSEQLFQWNTFAANQDMSAGATQTLDDVSVTITSSLPTGSTFIANYDVGNAAADELPSGQGFSTTSNARFFSNGNETNTTLTVDFDSADPSKSTEVHNVEFIISDIDGITNGGNNFLDVITVDAFDAEGNAITVDIEILGDDIRSGNTVTAANNLDATNETAGAIRITIQGPVERIVIDYDNLPAGGGTTTQQAVLISDIQFDAVSSQGNADLIDAGAGDDDVFAGSDNDTVFGGTGNDTIDGGSGDDSLSGGADDDSILGGSGNDTLEGDGGNDTLDGEAGDDSLSGGAGDDSLVGGSGSDTLDGGADNDVLDGGGNADSLVGGAGNDTIIGGGGADTAFGGDDADSITGGGGNDVLDGGSGGDTIDGGNNNDSITGGAGDDSLIGGAGSDTLAGGLGNDTILVGTGDTATGGDGDDLFLIDPAQVGGGTLTVVGGEGSETGGDTLDFNGLWVPGQVFIDDSLPDSAGGFSGSATLSDGTVVTFEQIEKIICFAHGTEISTPQGARRVEDLAPGDMVLTRDAGVQPLQWIGSRHVLTAADQAPIRFAPGTVGNSRVLRVSPQHRMLVRGWRAQLTFGEDEVLVPAKALIDGAGVVQEGVGPTSYFHLMTPDHEVIFAEGAETETFLPAAFGLEGIAAADREALFRVRPELRADLAAYGRAARPLAPTRLARLLAA
ncbi:Hint domain-containing protein [Jannaschia sp. KMU-145]|uniref:Hint domain-containing protein n=1 Tax=Jannaschia halovivens TaxID=3388667 RepID=UPI00396B293C